MIVLLSPLVLFAKVNNHRYHLIKDVLTSFCVISGQRVNFAKSKTFVSPYISVQNAGVLRNNIEMSLTTDLSKYLGFSLITGRKKREHF